MGPCRERASGARWMMHHLLLLALHAASEPLRCEQDWLVAADDTSARATLRIDAQLISLGNGLIERTFVTSPSFGTIDLKNLKTGDSALRHIVPEAALTIDGVHYTLGGLYIADVPSTTGENFQGQHAFLNRTGLATRLRVRPNAWTYASHHVSTPEADLPWVPGRRHSPTTVSWPPRGQRLSVRFQPPKGSPTKLQSLNITLVYELYDGAPMLSKWMEITASPDATAPLLVDAITTELLALNCDQSAKAKSPYGLGLFDALVTAAHGAATAWTTDANSTNDPGACEPIFSASYSGPPPLAAGTELLWAHEEVEVRENGAPPAPPPPPPSPPVVVPAAGPAVTLGGNSPLATTHFVSFRTIELLHDNLDPTRQMLAKHQIYRRLAPWVQENPLQLHLTNDTTAAFELALEQMHEVGWESLVLSFGSGFRYEMKPDDPYIRTLKANVAKATALGIEVGGYDLTVLDRGHHGYGGDVGAQWDRVDNGTLKADACYASGWRDKLEVPMGTL